MAVSAMRSLISTTIGGSEITETPERSAPMRKCIDGAAVACRTQEIGWQIQCVFPLS